MCPSSRDVVKLLGLGMAAIEAAKACKNVKQTYYIATQKPHCLSVI